MTDDDVIDAMLVYGGNFVTHLALTFRAADLENQRRLKLAFADEWQRYEELAQLRPAPPAPRA